MAAMMQFTPGPDATQSQTLSQDSSRKPSYASSLGSKPPSKAPAVQTRSPPLPKPQQMQTTSFPPPSQTGSLSLTPQSDHFPPLSSESAKGSQMPAKDLLTKPSYASVAKDLLTKPSHASVAKDLLTKPSQTRPKPEWLQNFVELLCLLLVVPVLSNRLQMLIEHLNQLTSSDGSHPANLIEAFRLYLEIIDDTIKASSPDCSEKKLFADVFNNISDKIGTDFSGWSWVGNVYTSPGREVYTFKGQRSLEDWRHIPPLILLHAVLKSEYHQNCHYC